LKGPKTVMVKVSVTSLLYTLSISRGFPLRVKSETFELKAGDGNSCSLVNEQVRELPGMS